MSARRICVLLPSHWSANLGGAEMQVKMLVERLATLPAFDVHYLARRAAADPRSEGYALHRVRARPAVAGTFIADVPQLLKALARLEPDVIYQRVACAYTGAAAWFARRHRCRMVWHVSSDRDLMALPWSRSWRTPLEQINRRMIDYGARHASAVVVQNREQAALLRERYGRGDGHLIPNFHPAATRASDKPQDRLTVCWIGNIKTIKRPDLFVNLARNFRDRRDTEFVIVGAPQMRADVWKAFQGEVADAGNVRYLGQQPLEAVEDLLSRAHVLVNTSPVEGFPNTFIQAWLRETPVLSLSVNPDGALDGEHHGICAHGNYDVLRNSLERLLGNAQLRGEMGRDGLAFASERFSSGNLERLIGLL